MQENNHCNGNAVEIQTINFTLLLFRAWLGCLAYSLSKICWCHRYEILQLSRKNTIAYVCHFATHDISDGSHQKSNKHQQCSKLIPLFHYSIEKARFFINQYSFTINSTAIHHNQPCSHSCHDRPIRITGWLWLLFINTR